MHPHPFRPAALAAGLLACVACATSSEKRPDPGEAPARAVATVTSRIDPKMEHEAEVAGYVPRERKEREVPPPTRRRRDYLLDEKRYVQLMKAHPRGFKPDDCKSLCQQGTSIGRSDDGRWNWVLRCVLNRNLRDEPVVSCREDALSDAELERVLGK